MKKNYLKRRIEQLKAQLDDPEILDKNRIETKLEAYSEMHDIFNDMYDSLILLQDIAEHGGADRKGQSIHPEIFRILAGESIKKAES